MRTHDRSTQRFDRGRPNILGTPARQWSMNADEPTFLPEDEVEIGDVAETDNELGIDACGLEVDLIGDFDLLPPPTGSEHRPDAGIAQCVVEVFDALLVVPARYPASRKTDFPNSTCKPQERKMSAHRWTPSFSGVLAGETMRTRSPGRSIEGRRSSTMSVIAVARIIPKPRKSEPAYLANSRFGKSSVVR